MPDGPGYHTVTSELQHDQDKGDTFTLSQLQYTLSRTANDQSEVPTCSQVV